MDANTQYLVRDCPQLLTLSSEMPIGTKEKLPPGQKHLEISSDLNKTMNLGTGAPAETRKNLCPSF